MDRVLGRFSVLLLALSVLGCSGGPVIPETVRVTGTVTYQDKPVEGSQVLLSSTDPKGKPASAVTDASGHFAVTTFVEGATSTAGALPGSYQVTITKLDATSALSGEDAMKAATSGKATGPKNLLPEKYSKAGTSGLTVEVKKGATSPQKFELVD